VTFLSTTRYIQMWNYLNVSDKVYHSSFRQLKGNTLRRFRELTWDAEVVSRGDVGVLRRTAGQRAGRTVRLRLCRGYVKKSINICSSARRFRQFYGSHMTRPQHLTLTQAHYSWKERLLKAYIFFFFFFFDWHYNPLCVLAFSVIFFHSALTLHWFL
jgi:hypothetical protein